MKTVNNDLTSYTKLCFVMLNSNESIKVARLQKVANQSMLTGVLLIERFFQWNKEKRWSFDKARNVLTWKKKRKNIDKGNFY